MMQHENRRRNPCGIQGKSASSGSGRDDKLICRRLAEALCRVLKTVVVCSRGFHMDRITGTQIAEVAEAVETIAKEWEVQGEIR